jgi:hypothetical protein
MAVSAASVLVAQMVPSGAAAMPDPRPMLKPEPPPPPGSFGTVPGTWHSWTTYFVAPLARAAHRKSPAAMTVTTLKTVKRRPGR